MKVYVVLETDYNYADINVVYTDRKMALEYKERREQSQLEDDEMFRSSFEIVEKELLG